MQSAPEHASPPLETVLSNFAGMVRRVGWRHRLSDADVDEVMQEVRIRLWRAQARSENTAYATASYVYKTAMSAALDLLRRRRTRRADMVAPIDEHEEDPRATVVPSADVAVEASELEEQVARAVETIPASRRPVVRMYLAGYHREEIAELLGWTEAKTRNLLYRGLSDLRERLSEWGISAEGAQ